MDPYEVLYDRRFCSPIGWFETSEVRPCGTDLLQDSLDRFRVIQDRLRVAHSRQKAYAKCRIRALRFGVGNRVFF